jgi:hypothetical protein
VRRTHALLLGAPLRRDTEVQKRLVHIQIAVHISHHKVKGADRGLVVVGGTARYGDIADGAFAIDEDQNDIIDKEMQAEETERSHRHSGVVLLPCLLACPLACPLARSLARLPACFLHATLPMLLQSINLAAIWVPNPKVLGYVSPVGLRNSR